MNNDTYAPVLEKAQAVLAQKDIPAPQVSFGDIRVSVPETKLFWIVSGVKRKVKRRLGK